MVNWHLLTMTWSYLQKKDKLELSEYVTSKTASSPEITVEM